MKESESESESERERDRDPSGRRPTAASLPSSKNVSVPATSPARSKAGTKVGR